MWLLSLVSGLLSPVILLLESGVGGSKQIGSHYLIITHNLFGELVALGGYPTQCVKMHALF